MLNKRPKKLLIIGGLFSLSFLPIESYATPCWKIWGRYTTKSTKPSDPAQISSRRDQVDLGNYDEIGAQWVQSLKGQLGKTGHGDLEPKIASIEKILIRNFLRHAYQNAVQHGTKSVEDGDFDAAIVDVTSTAHFHDGRLNIEITNPQIKPFPNSLVGRFYAGSKVEVPATERVGFVGRGVAYEAMIADLKELPGNSFIEWESTGSLVTFRISIDLLPVGHSTFISPLS